MKKKGFTLIELLAVIVILAVIALIAIPLIANVIETARVGRAKDSVLGYVSAIDIECANSILKNKTYADGNDYNFDEIAVNVKGLIPTSGHYTLRKGHVIEGTFCIDGYIINYRNKEVTVDGNCNPNDAKLDGRVVLSSNLSQISYPDVTTFEVIENRSGGELSCTSSNENVATCSINNSIVTVTSGAQDGRSDITVTSAETSKYHEAKAVHVAFTNGLLSVTANDYEGVYDGQPHGILVTSSGSTISYGETEGNYNLSESPTMTDAGQKTVYYSVSKEGYNPVNGSKTITITKALGSITAPIGKSVTYNGSPQELVTAGSSNTGTIQYKLNNGSYSTDVPTATEAGIYTIYYKVIGDNNHNDVAENNITVTINKASGSVTAPAGKTLTYTGSSQKLVTAGSSSTGTIEYKKSGGSYSTSIPTATSAGTYTIYYRVIGDENHDDVTERSVTSKINKASGSVTAPQGKTLTYTGSAQALITAGSSSTGTIQYKLDSGSYSTSIPTATATGTYTIYYKVVGDNNHYDVSENSVTSTIKDPTPVSLGSVTSSKANSSTKTRTSTFSIPSGTAYITVTVTGTSRQETAWENCNGMSYENAIAKAKASLEFLNSGGSAIGSATNYSSNVSGTKVNLPSGASSIKLTSRYASDSATGCYGDVLVSTSTVSVISVTFWGYE